MRTTQSPSSSVASITPPPPLAAKKEYNSESNDDIAHHLIIAGGQSSRGESHQSTSSTRSSSNSSSSSSSRSNMVYQYAFEEGLEMSLVPEEESKTTPFSLAGPKILELGLTGFTGRLIITQHTIKIKSQQRQQQDTRRRESLSSYASSSTEEAGRIKQPPLAPYKGRQAAASASAAKSRPPLPPNTSKKKDNNKKSRKRTTPGGGEANAEAMDDIAAVLLTRNSAKFVPVSLGGGNATIDSTSSVEEISVASSVSTRRATAIAEREETLDQMAAVFATHAKPTQEDRVPIDDGSSLGSVSTEVAAAIAKKEEEMDQFAAVFAAKTNKATIEDDKVPIDESSTFGGDGSSAGGSRASLRSIPENPLAEFTTAFVALSGPSTRPAVAGVRALAIDEESSAGGASSEAAASSSSNAGAVSLSSGSDGEGEEGETAIAAGEGSVSTHTKDHIRISQELEETREELKNCRAELQSLRQEVGLSRRQPSVISQPLHMMDSSSKRKPEASRTMATSKRKSSSSQPIEAWRGDPEPSQQNNPEDPLSDFTAAFVGLSGPNTRHTTEDVGGSIDGSSTRAAPSMASSQSSQGMESGEDVNEESPTKEEDVSTDPVAQFAIGVVSLHKPPPRPQDKLASIDEGSNPSASSAEASASSYQEEDTVSQIEQTSPSSEKPSEQLSQPVNPDDPISDFTAAFVGLSGPPKPPAQTDLIDEGPPSMAGSSSLSSASSAASSEQSPPQAHRVQSEQDIPTPLDPLDEYAEVFARTSTPVVKKKATEVIDEESTGSRGITSPSRASPIQVSATSSEEEPPQSHAPSSSGRRRPSGGPNQLQVSESRRASGGPSQLQVPEPPQGKAQADTPLRDNSQQVNEPKSSTRKQRRRSSQQGKPKSAPAGIGPKIPSEKKRRIREMFPNYPDVGTGSQGTLDPVGVYLHKKCSAPFEKTLTPRDLTEMLEVFPFAAYCADDKGRLPLHILGENSRLAKDPQGRQRATSLARLLIQAYPQSVTYPDSEGRLPFVALIQEWITWHYSQAAGESKEQRASTMSSRMSASLHMESNYDKLFPNFQTWPYAEWCLNMISMVLDDMVGTGLLKDAFANRPVSEQMEARRRYVEDIVLTVPYLLKSVLFVDGGLGATRKRMMQNSFVRRALLSRESVGKWLQDMVKRKGLPSKLAIDYFQLLSQTTPADFVGPKRNPDKRDIDAFHYERERVYRAIENLDLVIPSLVVLDHNETERAAATNVVWYIMSRRLSQPFVVGLLLIDFALHLSLTLAFRADVNLPQPQATFFSEVPQALIPAICVHYLMRFCCEALIYVMLSRRALWGYLTDYWNVIGFLAIVLTIVAHSIHHANQQYGQYSPVINAVVLAFLWLKVLGFLKFANKELALFVLALLQIVKDIRFFMVVFFALIFMFADMIHVIITTSDEGYCNSSDLDASRMDFCSRWSGDFYYRMYAVALGDFSLEEYEEPLSVAIIFFVFTILGVIILLNVLIAIISDSYERSKQSSVLLFGRARVNFVAQQIALESFLRPGRNPLRKMKHVMTGAPLYASNTAAGRIWRYTAFAIRWLVILSLIGSTTTCTFFIMGEMIRFRDLERPGLFFFYLFMSLVLLVANLTVCIFVFGDFFRIVTRGTFQSCTKFGEYWTGVTMNVVVVHVLGLQANPSSRDQSFLGEGRENSDFNKDEDNQEEEDVMERMFIMEKSLQKAVQDTKKVLTKRIETTEERLIKEEKKERMLLLKKLSTLISQLEDQEQRTRRGEPE